MAAETDVAGLNMYSDISNLEAPVFSTIDRKPQVHLLKLNWDQQVNLVGKKVPNPMFHCCDTCRKPILIYGRMIPCKHVYCFSCAKQDEKSCPRCKDKVKKVEQCDLGSIFLCTQGGTRYGNNGCRRTYLSSRDLQAHIKHRHAPKNETDDQRPAERKEISNSEAIRNAVNSLSKASLEAAVAAAKAASAVSSSSQYSNSAAAPLNSMSSGGQRGSAATATTNYLGSKSVANQSTVYQSSTANQSAAVSYTSAGAYRPRGGTNEAPAATAYGTPAGVYPGYTQAPYTTQYNTTPTTIGYTQGTHSSYSQPPPSAYSYAGGYGSAAAGQYPTTAAGGVVPQVAATAAYPSTAGAQATAPPQAGSVGGQSYAFNRPPPTGVRPAGPGGNSRQPPGSGTQPGAPRQPPPAAGQYYRR